MLEEPSKGWRWSRCHESKEKEEEYMKTRKRREEKRREEKRREEKRSLTIAICVYVHEACPCHCIHCLFDSIREAGVSKRFLFLRRRFRSKLLFLTTKKPWGLLLNKVRQLQGRRRTPPARSIPQRSTLLSSPMDPCWDSSSLAPSSLSFCKLSIPSPCPIIEHPPRTSSY